MNEKLQKLINFLNEDENAKERDLAENFEQIKDTFHELKKLSEDELTLIQKSLRDDITSTQHYFQAGSEPLKDWFNYKWHLFGEQLLNWLDETTDKERVTLLTLKKHIEHQFAEPIEKL